MLRNPKKKLPSNLRATYILNELQQYCATLHCAAAVCVGVGWRKRRGRGCRQRSVQIDGRWGQGAWAKRATFETETGNWNCNLCSSRVAHFLFRSTQFGSVEFVSFRKGFRLVGWATDFISSGIIYLGVIGIRSTHAIYFHPPPLPLLFIRKTYVIRWAARPTKRGILKWVNGSFRNFWNFIYGSNAKNLCRLLGGTRGNINFRNILRSIWRGKLKFAFWQTFANETFANVLWRRDFLKSWQSIRK